MKILTKALTASAAILILTMFHHFYAAAIFDTPWRRHVAVVVMPVLLAMVVLYFLHRWRPLTFVGKASLWLFMLVMLLVPIAWFGLYHGGYSHLVKNVLSFGGVPGDLVYEVTGVMEFVLAVFAARYLFRLWRESRAESHASNLYIDRDV